MDQPTDSKPDYPICILPSEFYHDRIRESGLYDIKNGLIIQRRCAGDANQITPEIFGTDLKEMSVNLLGGKFEPEDVKFIPYKPKNLPCVEVFSGEYYYDDTLKGIYIAIKDIHAQTFPSPREFPNKAEFDKVAGAIKESSDELSEKDRLLNAFAKRKREFSTKEKYIVSYRITVMHRPSNANYWHCQIEIAPDCEDGKTVNKDSAKWQKDALCALTNFLVAYTSFSYPDPIPPVCSEWYVKEPA